MALVMFRMLHLQQGAISEAATARSFVLLGFAAWLAQSPLVSRLGPAHPGAERELPQACGSHTNLIERVHFHC